MSDHARAYEVPDNAAAPLSRAANTAPIGQRSPALSGDLHSIQYQIWQCMFHCQEQAAGDIDNVMQDERHPAAGL